MTDTIENLYHHWAGSYAARTITGEGASIACETARANGGDGLAAESVFDKKYVDPHTDAQMAAEEAIFDQPANSLRQMCIKVLVAFTDTDDPRIECRESLLSDARRVLDLPPDNQTPAPEAAKLPDIHERLTFMRGLLQGLDHLIGEFTNGSEASNAAYALSQEIIAKNDGIVADIEALCDHERKAK